MNTSQLGNIGEAKVLCKFAELQVPVYLPYGDGNDIDLIAIFNGKINTIQVKTTEKLHENSYMIWKLTKQDGYHGSRKCYDANIDYFALYCLETDVLCLVPYLETEGKKTIQIRLDSYSGRRLSTMHFVQDFSFENQILSH